MRRRCRPSDFGLPVTVQNIHHICSLQHHIWKRATRNLETSNARGTLAENAGGWADWPISSPRGMLQTSKSTITQKSSAHRSS